LFIAPPDLELNKTKRWQWRFFILHDDGELTYSLDENPLTLPQGCINMCKCEGIIELNNHNLISTENDLETSTTGRDFSGLVSYPYSLCLRFSPPNKDIYIAAGNFEEISKWRDILSIYCKRPVHKTESSPVKSVTPKEIHLADIDDFQNIDDLGDDEEVEAYQEGEEDAYEYDENEFMTLMSDGRKTAEFYYSSGFAENKNKPSLSSSSSSLGSGSNLNRKRNESLKMKMMSGIRKSKSKSGKAKESQLEIKETEKAVLDNSNSSSSSVVVVGVVVMTAV